MERSVRVKILDHEYLIKSDEDTERVRLIAQYVNKKFSEIIGYTNGISERKTAILAAFHIASDYFELLEERDRLVETIQKRSKMLNKLIDSAVK